MTNFIEWVQDNPFPVIMFTLLLFIFGASYALVSLLFHFYPPTDEKKICKENYVFISRDKICVQGYYPNLGK